MIEADGTENKSNLGPTRSWPVSLAPTPLPAQASCPCFATSAESAPTGYRFQVMNIINGGRHADNPIDIRSS